MSISTIIVGVRDLRKEFDKMWTVAKACEKAKITFPKEVCDYFIIDADQKELDDKSCYEQEKLTFDLKGKPGVKTWSADMEEGFEVDLTKLPKDVKKIRFYNSY